jgi:hypothetical protein
MYVCVLMILIFNRISTIRPGYTIGVFTNTKSHTAYGLAKIEDYWEILEGKKTCRPHKTTPKTACRTDLACARY